MKKGTGVAAAVLAAASIALGASKADEPGPVALYFADLGPDELDVSGYPERQKETYKVFARVCSQCHTAARPLWSAVKDRSDWERYVRRMKARTASRSGTEILKADAEAIVEFLAYDSKVRKIDASAEFEEKRAELKERFERLAAERKRRSIEADREKARPQAPYTGTRP